MPHGTEPAANEYRVPEGRRAEKSRNPEEGAGRIHLSGYAQSVSIPLHRPQPDYWRLIASLIKR